MDSSAPQEIKLHLLDYLRVVRVRWPLILLIFLLVMVAAGVVTYLMPRKYSSSVTMQVKQADFSMDIFSDRPSSMSRDMNFSFTQNEIIQLTEVLNPVIDSLHLTERWREYGVTDRRSAYELLRRMLKVEGIRNTDLIAIVATSFSPQEAAEIANAVAEEYQRKRIAEVQLWLNKSLTTLDQELVIQRKEVDRLRAETTRLREEQQIIDLNPDSVEESSTASDQVLITLEQEVNAERSKVAALRARYDQVRDLSDETMIRSATALEINDPVLTQMWPAYQESAAEESRLLSDGLGVNHPTVKALRAHKEERLKQLNQQVAAYRKSLTSTLAVAEETLKKLEERLMSMRGDQLKTRSSSVEYTQAKNNYIQAKKILEGAELRLSSEKMQVSMPQSPAIIWEIAEPSQAPSSPNILLNMALAAVVGLVFGFGVAFFIEYLDTSVKTLEEVETLLNVPVLAVITKNIKILLNEPDNCPDAEAYRILRTNVEFNRKNPDANTITVVSGGAGEGKSTTIANLAHTFAKGGYNTLIVDADMRRPTQHRIFNASNDRGLTDYLMNKVTIEDVVLPTTTPNLYLMPSGRQPLDAVGILNSQRLDELLTEVKARFDMVFFDSPPILGVSDAAILSSALDYTLIVVQHRRFPKNMLSRVKQAINNVGGNILGVVLNDVDVRHDSQYEYYTNYYHYYATPQGERKREKKAASKKAAEVSSTPRTSSRSGGSSNSTDY